MTPNQRVKEVRKRLRLLQVDFCRSLDISQPYLSEVENGKDKRGKPLQVSEEIRRKLWDVYNVNISWLMAGGEDSEMFLTEKKSSMYESVSYTNDTDIERLTSQLKKCMVELDQLREQNAFYKQVILNLSNGKESQS